MPPSPTLTITNTCQVCFTTSTHLCSLPFAPASQENFCMGRSLKDNSLCRSSRINLKESHTFKEASLLCQFCPRKKTCFLPTVAGWALITVKTKRREGTEFQELSQPCRHWHEMYISTYKIRRNRMLHSCKAPSCVSSYVMELFLFANNCPVPGITSLAPRESLWGAELDSSPLTSSYPRTRSFFKNKAHMLGCATVIHPEMYKWLIFMRASTRKSVGAYGNHSLCS